MTFREHVSNIVDIATGNSYDGGVTIEGECTRLPDAATSDEFLEELNRVAADSGEPVDLGTAGQDGMSALAKFGKLTPYLQTAADALQNALTIDEVFSQETSQVQKIFDYAAQHEFGKDDLPDIAQRIKLRARRRIGQIYDSLPDFHGPKRKLSNAQISEIRGRLKSERAIDLAREFNVSHVTIGNIKSGSLKEVEDYQGDTKQNFAEQHFNGTTARSLFDARALGRMDEKDFEDAVNEPKAPAIDDLAEAQRSKEKRQAAGIDTTHGRERKRQKEARAQQKQERKNARAGTKSIPLPGDKVEPEKKPRKKRTPGEEQPASIQAKAVIKRMKDSAPSAGYEEGTAEFEELLAFAKHMNEGMQFVYQNVPDQPEGFRQAMQDLNIAMDVAAAKMQIALKAESQMKVTYGKSVKLREFTQDKIEFIEGLLIRAKRMLEK